MLSFVTMPFWFSWMLFFGFFFRLPWAIAVLVWEFIKEPSAIKDWVWETFSSKFARYTMLFIALWSAAPGTNTYLIYKIAGWLGLTWLVDFFIDVWNFASDLFIGFWGTILKGLVLAATGLS